jgi:hypothetical protein
MQLGDYRFGQMHCQLAEGCPDWGLKNEYHLFKTDIGIVCMGFWDPILISCSRCMNTCISCPDAKSCNQFCYEKFPNCEQCNESICTQC